MTPEHQLKRSVFFVVGWSAMMLSLAEGAFYPAGATIPILVIAWLAERRDRFRCPNWLAAILGLGGLALSVMEFLSDNLEARLLSGVHFLVYLTWIFLFRRKQMREYWVLAALSLLQVAVGSVLTFEGWYGVLLLVNLCAMLWMLALMCLFVAHREYDRTQAVAMSFAGPTGGQAGSRTTATAQIDFGEKWAGAGFRRMVRRTVLGTGLIAAVVFAIVPRVWVGNPFTDAMMKAGRDQSTLTGFSEYVRLGELGEILESYDPVLQMRMFDNDTGEQISVAEYAAMHGMAEPLFRGSVLGDYKNGRWKKARYDGAVGVPLNPEVLPPATVRQEIKLEPIHTSLLFCLTPYQSMTVEYQLEQVRSDVITLSLRQKKRGREAIKYTVISPKTPEAQSFSAWNSRSPEGETWILNRFRRFPDRGLRRLSALARTVSGADEQPPPSTAEQTRRLVSFLTDPTEFEYSLTTTVTDRRADPVEDFLFNEKKGNCEYFAAALTLMLRSLAIPARMVTGFKGGYTNDLDGTFAVQQLHAHAWVEAWIDERDGWTVYDPTPGQRTLTLAAMQPSMKTLSDVRMWFNTLWSSLVINMSLDQQKARFYEPLRKQFAAFMAALRGEKTASGRLKLTSWTTWWSVPGLLLVAGVGALIWLARKRGMLGRLRRTLAGDRNGATGGITREQQIIRFYEQFRDLCRSHGLSRQPSQTEFEFVRAVQTQWETPLSAAGLERVPRELAEQFYRVRFGRYDLDGPSTTRLQDQLAAMDNCLKNGDGEDADSAASV